VSALYLYDDAQARTFAPFALTRPVGEMRAGAELLRVRWEHALGRSAAGSIAAPHLADFEEAGAPPVASGTLAAGSIIANARCAVALARSAPTADLWRCGGRVAAVTLARETPVSAFAGGERALESLAPPKPREAEVEGRWLDEVWSFIVDLLPQLAEDVAALGPSFECVTPHDVIVLGQGDVFLERGATIEPMACIDVSAGPVLVRKGATVRAFSRLVGPCVVGPQSSILGDRVAGCSIGEGCIVRGEMSETIVLGQANKAHDGFVGHSYLGRWVNLGAGTITSNLKNTYGTVTLWTPTGPRDTGVLKLGSLLGDHVKTGIGLRLTTGTVVGAGSNIYGSTMPPKYVPPFSWGEAPALERYRLDRFLATTDRAMRRRGLSLGERACRQLAAAHAASEGAR